MKQIKLYNENTIIREVEDIALRGTLVQKFSIDFNTGFITYLESDTGRMENSNRHIEPEHTSGNNLRYKSFYMVLDEPGIWKFVADININIQVSENTYKEAPYTQIKEDIEDKTNKSLTERKIINPLIELKDCKLVTFNISSDAGARPNDKVGNSENISRTLQHIQNQKFTVAIPGSCIINVITYSDSNLPTIILTNDRILNIREYVFRGNIKKDNYFNSYFLPHEYTILHGEIRSNVVYGSPGGEIRNLYNEYIDENNIYSNNEGMVAKRDNDVVTAFFNGVKICEYRNTPRFNDIEFVKMINGMDLFNPLYHGEKINKFDLMTKYKINPHLFSDVFLKINPEEINNMDIYVGIYIDQYIECEEVIYVQDNIIHYYNKQSGAGDDNKYDYVAQYYIYSPLNLGIEEFSISFSCRELSTTYRNNRSHRTVHNGGDSTLFNPNNPGPNRIIEDIKYNILGIPSEY